MKRKPFAILLLYFIFLVSGSLHAVGEKTVSLGGVLSWDSALIRSGVDEASRLRTWPVLILAAGDPSVSGADLSLSFDEGIPGQYRDGRDHYAVTVSPEVKAAGREWARSGGGAALFSGGTGGPLIVEAKSLNALFAPGRRIRDFSLEFWLYPFNLENGEEIFSWESSLPKDGRGAADYTVQQIQCVAAKNRLSWSFRDFFVSPDGSKFLDLAFSGDTPVVPRTWSHHQIYFDSDTGMIEYAVDGNVQTITYAALPGREGGEVYTPAAGIDGCFSLGGGFAGIMDEFRIYDTRPERPSLRKYPRAGRMETLPIDLGGENSEVIKVEARGGRTSPLPAGASAEFQENGRFRFADASEMQFFIRGSENPYWWDDSPWRVFVPGSDLPGGLRGRYVQIAVDFYPSADGLGSPYLEDMRITYMPDEPPMPPMSLTAAATDGGVQLRWKNSPDADTTGYLVYYGTVKGDYFGESAILGISPIDAGQQNSLFIDGLKNGVLYYFRVAAYSRRDTSSLRAGEFSREVSARPLEGL